METKEFETLKKKHEILKRKNIENETNIKSILKQLKNEFEANNIEEAENLITHLEEKVETDTKQLDSVVERIRKAADWENISDN